MPPKLTDSPTQPTPEAPAEYPNGLQWLGSGFFVGIPARDLTAEEAEQFDAALLIASGHYKIKE